MITVSLDTAVLVIAVPVYIVLGVAAWLLTPADLRFVARIVAPIGMIGAYLVLCAAILSVNAFYIPGCLLVLAAYLIHRKMSRAAGTRTR
jgi:hypothetical protein